MTRYANRQVVPTMNFYFKYVFLFICIGSSQSSNAAIARKGRSLPVVDALISRLQHDRWPAGEAACQRATLNMLHAVTNNTLWAVWAWDSIQLPMGSMYGAEAYVGNYDQCLDAPWATDGQHPGLRSQYCLLEVTTPRVDHTRELGPFDDAYEYYRTPTKDGRFFNHHYFGVCVPSVCSPPAVGRVARHLLQLSHLPGDVHIDVQHCDTAGEPVNYTTGFYVFWILIGLLTTISVYSTYCTNMVVRFDTLERIKRSFCFKKNYTSLFNVESDDIKCLYGIRFISSLVVVAAHEIFYQLLLPNINGLQINKKLTSTFILSIIHIDVLVDTFFLMSGLLIVRGLLTQKQNNLLVFLLKRYFRLIVPNGLAILFTVTAMSLVDRGPIWQKSIDVEKSVCEQYWWKSILMINTDIESMCNVTTWYISCDFQLTVMVILFIYLYKKNKRLGFAVFTMTAVSLTVYLACNVFWKQLAILPFNYRIFKMMRENTELHDTYVKSHVRAGSYLVGMAMGYIFATYKPERYRNVIDKKWSIILAIVSGAVMCGIVSLGIIIRGRPYNALEAAVVVATNRIIWAVAICCIIGLCEYGTLPKVPDLLSWHVFVPLSKLSYCLYLLHPLLILMYKLNTRGPHFLNYYHMVVQWCGIVVIGCVASLIMHLVVEAPFSNISSILLSKIQMHRDKSQSPSEKSNGSSNSRDVQERLTNNKTK